jgi:hypothetical protein
VYKYIGPPKDSKINPIFILKDVVLKTHEFYNTDSVSYFSWKITWIKTGQIVTSTVHFYPQDQFEEIDNA